MMRMKASAITFGVALAAAARATCPYTECNYLDPQYQADSKKWSDCADLHVNRTINELDKLAVLFPRFGIDWRSYRDEVNSASHPDGPFDDAAVKAPSGAGLGRYRGFSSGRGFNGLGGFGRGLHVASPG
jgi:hypothetical protein